MLNKVLKFGGSSLADAGQFAKVREIIKSQPSRRYIVASAPGKRFTEDKKVTDLLYSCHRLSAEGESFDDMFKLIEERFNSIIEELALDLSLEQEFENIKRNIKNEATEDYVVSRGEYLNSMILANYIGYSFIDAADCIFFNEQGSLDSKKTYETIALLLKDHQGAVIPGFYGADPSGNIKTFSRGGSDITGSIVARALKADIYENWTDVSGMLMADPRCVENPRTIDMITYQELRELAYMGATVMHEEAIFPVRNARIPINIRNTNSPEDTGTMIVSYAPKSSKDSIITGIAGKVGFSTIAIEKSMMNSELGFGRKVLQILEENQLPFEHLPTGIDTMSVIVHTEDLNPIKDALVAEIYNVVDADEVIVEDGLAMIAVVGRDMTNTKGTASRIFTAIAKSSVNIRMIDQGSSEMNIIVGVDEKDYIKAINAIYFEFAK